MSYYALVVHTYNSPEPNDTVSKVHSLYTTEQAAEDAGRDLLKKMRAKGANGFEYDWHDVTGPHEVVA